MFEKDIRFVHKKVDESWKDQAKPNTPSPSEKNQPAVASAQKSQPQSEPKTSKSFMNLVTSLGMQAMMHLGEIPHPETNQPEEDLQAAREMIELLMALQEKTRGGLSLQEDKTLSGLVSELQIKFSQKA